MAPAEGQRLPILPRSSDAHPPADGADAGEPGELVCVSRAGRLLWVTEASKRILGWSAAATHGDPHAGTPPEAREEIERMHGQIESGETRRLTSPVVLGSGETRLAEWRVTRARGRIYTWFVRFAERRRWPRREKERA